jgi:2-dehydro-3-deoxygluconokinase
MPNEHRFDVTALGESMLRLSVPAGQRLEAADQFAVHLAGAESNVCGALVAIGRRAGWVSRLPESAVGRLVLRQLRAAGVDTGAVVLAPDARLGIYYAEFAGPPRAIQVIYDRANSAAANLTAADVNWDYLLDTTVVHLTGITPALNEGCRALVAEIIQRARAAGVKVSFDVNYRGKLWTPEQAAATLKPLIKDANLLLCGQADARTVFGLSGDEHALLAGLRALTPAKHIVLTRGELGAVALEGDQFYSQPAVPVQIVDRVGAGDAFAAGVIDGLLSGSLPEGLKRGTALAALVLSQEGDTLMTTRAEMEATIAKGAAAGGIVR